MLRLFLFGRISRMLKKIFKLILKFSLFAAAFALLLTLLPRLITALYASTRVDPIVEAPSKPVAIVFGAGLTRDGRATRVLRDRVETGARLYFAGKVEKLLMSGDNSFVDFWGGRSYSGDSKLPFASGALYLQSTWARCQRCGCRKPLFSEALASLLESARTDRNPSGYVGSTYQPANPRTRVP
jgi:uncharacterized SAM-binding protein YcdF (DUF218 family)